MNSPLISFPFFFETANGLQVLNGHTLHVLSPPGINIPLFIFEGLEGITGPRLLKDGDNVRVGVEKRLGSSGLLPSQVMMQMGFPGTGSIPEREGPFPLQRPLKTSCIPHNPALAERT
ncbi:Aminoacylase 1 [Caligus rogercresseyi]|uniref:Aminoacylase 1 n=1 Tax=Caligus rogercresseyi TaxID=217165 RepID=A0A7T8GWD2_CALRO|nr:Aminoacylase 1 [Caligus rogercresseyi]